MGRITLPEASHVSPDVASDTLLVLEPRIPAETAVPEDPHRRFGRFTMAVVVVVVDVNLHSSHCFFSVSMDISTGKDPTAELTGLFLFLFHTVALVRVSEILAR